MKQNEMDKEPLYGVEDQKYIYCGGSSNMIQRIDLRTNETKNFQLNPKVTCTNFSQFVDEDTLILALEGRSPLPRDFIGMYDLKKKKLDVFKTNVKPSGHIWNLVHDKKRELIVAGTWGNCTLIFNMKGEKLNEIKHEAYVNYCAIHEGSNKLFSGSNDQHISSFCLEKNQYADKFKFGAEIKSFDLRENELLVSAGSSLGIVDIRSEIRFTFPKPKNFPKKGNHVHISRFSPFHEHLFISCGSNSVFLNDDRKPSTILKEGEEILTRACYRMKFLQGEKYFAVNGEDGTNRIFEIESLRLARRFDGMEIEGFNDNSTRLANLYAMSYLPDDLGLTSNNSLLRQGILDLEERIEYLRNFEDEEVQRNFGKKMKMSVTSGSSFSLHFIFLLL